MASGQSFRGQRLRRKSFAGADLRDADFEGADLRRADFRGACLDGANLTAADLAFANLTSASLRGARTSGTNMMGAKLLGVQVDADTLAGADTFGAVLDGSPRDVVSPLWAFLFAVTWLCDGELVATIDDRGRLAIWDGDTLECVRVVELGVVGYRPLSARADGRMIAVAVDQKGILIVDPASGRVVTHVRVDGTSSSIAWSPDGTRLAVSSPTGITRVWDLAKAAPMGQVREEASGNVVLVAFSPDGSRFATAAGRTVRVWDTESRRELLEFAVKEPCRAALRWSADGKRIYGASLHRTLEVIDLDARAVASSKPECGWHSLSFAADEIAVGGVYQLNVIELPSGRVRKTFGDARSRHATRGVAIHPDGARVATVRGDGALMIWSLETGELVVSGGTVQEPLFSSIVLGNFTEDEKLPTSPDPHTVWLWDLHALEATKGEVPTRPSELHAWRRQFSARSLDGAITARESVMADAIVISDGRTGAELYTVPISAFMAVPYWALSPDGRWLATHGCWDARFIVRHARTGQVHFELPTMEIGAGIAFRPDGERVCEATSEIRIVETATGKILRSWSNGGALVHYARFSTDGTTLVTSSNDLVLRVWDAESGALSATLSSMSDGWAACGSGGRFKRTGDPGAAVGYRSGLRRLDVEDLEAAALGTGKGLHSAPPTPPPLVEIAADPEVARVEPVALSHATGIAVPGTAVWSRRWVSDGQHLSVERIAARPSGDIVVTGVLAGSVRWSASAVSEVPFGCYWTTLAPDGEPQRCRTVAYGSMGGWPQIALGRERCSIAWSLQGTAVVDGQELGTSAVQWILVVDEDIASGTQRFARMVGDVGLSFSRALYRGPAGQLYVVGDAHDHDAHAAGTYQSQRTLFVRELDPSGDVCRDIRTGGPATYAHAAFLDPHGAHVLLGHFLARASFGGDVFEGRQRTFMAKLGPNGEHVWSGLVGGAAAHLVPNAAMHADGSLVMCMRVDEPLELFGRSYDDAAKGFVLMRLDGDARVVWIRRFEVPTFMWGSVFIMKDGSLLVWGSFKGALDLGAGRMESEGSNRAPTSYLAHFDAEGRPKWSQTFGKGDAQIKYAVPGEDGTVVVAGNVDGVLDLGAGEMPASGRSDVFVAKIAL